MQAENKLIAEIKNYNTKFFNKEFKIFLKKVFKHKCFFCLKIKYGDRVIQTKRKIRR